MKDMTSRERSVFEYIKNSLSDNGYAPSVRDIRDALGFKSTSTVHMYLTRLADRGLITRDGGKSRAIHMDGVGAANQVPLVGRVTAGKPILAQESLAFYQRERFYHGFLKAMAQAHGGRLNNSSGNQPFLFWKFLQRSYHNNHISAVRFYRVNPL